MRGRRLGPISNLPYQSKTCGKQNFQLVFSWNHLHFFFFLKSVLGATMMSPIVVSSRCAPHFPGHSCLSLECLDSVDQAAWLPLFLDTCRTVVESLTRTSTAMAPHPLLLGLRPDSLTLSWLLKRLITLILFWHWIPLMRGWGLFDRAQNWKTTRVRSLLLIALDEEDFADQW